jgi:hypothetical protein
MQTPQTVEPTAPTPPNPTVEQIKIDIPGITGTPMTRQEMQAIRARRSELSNQLTSAEGRRERLAAELREAPPEARSGLQERIAVLDERIVQLEQDIASTGRQLTNAPAGVFVATSQVPSSLGGLESGQVTAISIVFTVLVLFPLAIAYTRILWRRATHGPVPAMSKEVLERFDKLEQAVDTVAVEMERVSESQRFMTKLLMEPNALASLGAGQLEDVRPVRDALGVRRQER